ncbi:MAG: hypothetical protein LBS07_04675 [Prevotellaceae bacterium]|nr:hypothetical protein [Prevotellaceae bacterium]
MKFFVLSLLLVSAFGVQAQQHKDRPRIEDMHAKKWAELSAKAKLTEQEKTVVYPVFMEYEDAVWKLFKQNREVMKSLRNKKDDASLNYEEINNKYIEQEVKQIELLQEYHKKLTKILAPRKLFDYYLAERVYKRQLLQNMPPHLQKK